MNRSDDFIGQLEDYLDTFDGATPLPERVRDAISASLPRTRQVRPARGSERMLQMITRTSTGARLGLAAAVVVAAVVLGGAFLGNRGESPAVGAAPSTPSTAPEASQAMPSPAPAASPSGPTSILSAPSEPCFPGGAPDCIAPGTYQLATGLPAGISLDVPAGWFRWIPAAATDGLLVDSGPDAPAGSGWGVAFLTVGAVPLDPCDPAKGSFDEAQTATVDGLVTAMASWPGFETTTPTAIEMDGVSGQELVLTSSRTLEECPDASIWKTTGGLVMDGYPVVNQEGKPLPAEFRIFDVGGRLLVVRSTAFTDVSPFEAEQGVAPDPNRHAEDLVELRAMLDSIELTPTP